MIDWIGNLISKAVAERGTSFVFPSQAVADSWLRGTPGLTGRAAIESGRFVGWDRFKEKLLSRHQERRPADRVSRSLWASLVLARQARTPFLKNILGPYPPTSAFAGFLTRIPPSLAALFGDGPSGGDDPILRDLELLRDDYAAFLDGRGLFEPAWEPLPTPQPRERYEVIAPELMEDFGRYEASLARVEGIGIHHLEPAPLPSLLRFPNAFEELRWAFLEIANLLDRGERPENISVTLPSLDEAAPYIRAAAARAGVPVVLREGGLLSASPYGRLLRAMSECSRSGFAFDQTRDFLLDRFVSWKGSLGQAARDLVRFGIEHHAYAPYVDKGRHIDVWEESFELCGTAAERDLRGFYRRLRGSVGALSDAKDFHALEGAIIAFREQFLDERGWGGEEVSRVQRAMVELASLSRAEEELGCRGEIPEPFSLFLRTLGDVRYVPRSPIPAVSVYPYRVSALLATGHHFVLGCSQEGTTVRYTPASFLREDQKQLLGMADLDASEDFAAAYALDPGARFSCAEQGLGGWSAPAVFFQGSTPLLPDREETLRRDPLHAETQGWKTGAALPRSMLPFQRQAFFTAGVSLTDKGSDYSTAGGFASASARAEALAPRRTESGSLRLSATQLEEYLACPFGWLLTRALGLEDEPSGVGFFDARLAGEMAHEAIRRLFSAIAKTGPFTSARLEGYLTLVPPAVSSVLASFERAKGPFLVPMFSAYAPLLEDRLKRLLADEGWMEGWEVGDFERSLGKEYPGLGLLLEGRVDRVSRLDDKVALIDYKKRRLPRKADLLVEPAGGSDPAGGLPALQIAAYVTLCEAAGGRVERAAYWSIEEAKRLVVIGPGGLRSRQEYGFELAAFERSLSIVAEGLSLGDFRLTRDGGDECASCGWAAVCRCRYATE